MFFELLRKKILLILAALIEEAVSENFSVFHRLLEDLKKNPADWHLKNFLFHFMRTKDFALDSKECLIAIASVAHSDDFYYLSEKLWFDFAKDKGVEECCKLLAEVEENIGYIPIESQSAFYRKFCIRYLFDLKEDFLDEKMEIIEDQSEESFFGEDYEISLLNALIEYRKSLDVFLNGDLINQKLHRIIKAWCSADEAMRQQAFINETIDLDLGQILDAKDYNDQKLAPCAEVFEYISSEMDDGSFDDLMSEKQKEKKIRVFMICPASLCFINIGSAISF